jgi:transglutaminase-like putative cysteine protease
MKWILTVLLALATAGSSCPGFSQTMGDTYDTADTILQEDFDYVVEADGRYVVEHFKRFRPKNAQAAEALAQQHFPFSELLESLSVVEAYTLAKDGRKLPVTDIRTTSSPVAQSAQIYGDHKVTTLVFPAAEPGVEMVYRIRTEQRVPLFPKAFFAGHTFAREFDFKQVSIRVRAPRSLPLYAEAHDMQGGEIEADDQGRRQWRWTYSGGKPEAPEPGSVNNADYSPRIAFTSFASYADVGHAYRERASPKAGVTPTIQAQADKITAGIDTPQGQAEAIHRWVTDNVRYMALYLGFGGVVPHSADEVLRNRYGDCKDVTTLMQALLASKGMRSEAVLVNLTPGQFAMPSVALPVGIFNHVILYLPDQQVYLDGTARFNQFGVLPSSLGGKTALRTGDDKEKAQLVTLPLADAKHNVARLNMALKLDSKGTIEGESRVQGLGAFDLALRSIADTMPQGMAQQIGAQLLQMTGQQGAAALYKGTPRDLSSPYVMRGTFTLRDMVAMPGPSSFALPQGLQGFFSIRGLFAAFVPERRTKPMLFERATRDETVELTMPDNISVVDLPKSRSLRSPFGQFESTWAQDGNRITVHRVLVFDHTRPTLDPDEYLQLRSMMEGAAADIRAQIRIK